jgi:predicted nucleic-acid-binding Zn-ribbon protein
MKQTGKCPKCGSTRLIDRAHVLDYTFSGRQNLKVAVEKNPEAWRPEVLTGELAAWICIQCGFTELYCVDLIDESVPDASNG